MDMNIKVCGGCPLCRFTRGAKKETIFYSIARKIQKRCPNCSAANKKLNKDFQKSEFLNK